MDLVSKMLVYNPYNRIKPFQALAHKLFDELREEDLLLPNGNCIPDLFNFSDKEIERMGSELRETLIPKWYDPETSPCVHVMTEEQMEAL